MWISDFISVINAAVYQVQVVHFDVSSAKIVRVLILLLGHNVGIDVVVERAVGMETVFVQVVRSSISHSLADWHFIFIVLELVIIATVDVA